MSALRKVYYGITLLEVGLLFYFIFYIYSLLLPPSVWDLTMLNALVLRWWFILSFFVFIPFTTLLVNVLSSLLFSSIGVFGDKEAIFEYIIRYWGFSREFLSDINQFFESGIFGVFDLIHYFVDPLIYFGIFLILGISIISLITYLLSPNTKAVISIVTGGIFTIAIGSYMGWIILQIPSSSQSFTSFIFSEQYLLAFLFFLILELGFYVDYMKRIVMPSQLQEQIIMQRLHIIEQKAKQIPKIKEKSLKSKTSWLANILSGDAFYFVRDILETRREKEAAYIQLEDEKTARHLSSYIRQVRKFDPNAVEKITGKTYLPSAFSIVQSLVLSLMFHFMILSLLTFVVFNTVTILSSIFPSNYIINSVEGEIPEITLIFLLPLALTPIAISLIIKLVKRSRKQISYPLSLS